MVVHTCSPRTQNGEANESGIQGHPKLQDHPWLHSKFQTKKIKIKKY